MSNYNGITMIWGEAFDVVVQRLPKVKWISDVGIRITAN